MNPLWVAGVGLIAPGLESWSAAQPVLTAAVPWCASEAALPAPAMLPKNERRRASPTIRLALGAAQQAIDAAGVVPGELAAFFGSSSGDGDVLHALLEMVTGPEGRASPTLFHNSVHNAAAGYWGIATGATEASNALCAHDASFAAGLLEALCQVAVEHTSVLLIAYDAPYPEPVRSMRPIPETFGVALVLAPVMGPASLARLEVDRSAQACGAMEDAALEALRRSVPAARSLPLLEHLARRATGRVHIDYLEGTSLAVDVTPCH